MFECLIIKLLVGGGGGGCVKEDYACEQKAREGNWFFMPSQTWQLDLIRMR